MKQKSQNKDRVLLPLRLRRPDGYTLIELVIVTVIVAVLAGTVAQLFLMGIKAYHVVSYRKNSLQGIRMAVQRMNREIREIKDSDSIINADSHRLKFVNVDNNEISFSFSKGKLYLNGYTLGEDIQDFKFRYSKADGSILQIPVPSDSLSFIWGIGFSLLAEKENQKVTLTSSIHPRNF